MAKLVDSDDEFDEYFDRTKMATVEQKQLDVQAQPTDTYESLKARLEVLCKERQHMTVELRNVQSGSRADADDEDELEAYMNINTAQLKQEKLQKLTSRLA